jgi:hypothetical protein
LKTGATRPEDTIVLGVILILILVWAGLIMLLWAGSVWFQGYIYSEPAPQLAWTAPVAGTALAAFLALWCLIDSRSPGQYTDLFHFSPREDHEPYTELWAVKGQTKTRYTLTKDPLGRLDYRDANGKPIPTHADQISAKEDGEEVTFEPERDADGKYKMRTGRSLIYHDARGREMSEDNLGQISTFRWGVFLGAGFLNAFHLALWFLCLWLLLRFQWSHALGLAVIFWLISTVLIVPTLLAKVETAATSPRTAVRGLERSITECA